MRRRVFLPLVFLCGLSAVTAGFAAGEQGEFKTKFAQWKQNLSKLRELAESYQLADDNARPKIEAEYNQLIEKGRSLVPGLKQAAEKAYLADPNKDAEVGEFLISAVGDSLTRDDYEEAYRLGKLLADNKFSNSQIYHMAGAAAFYVNEYADARKYLAAAEKAGQSNEQSQRALSLLDQYEEHWSKEKEIREAEAKADDLPRVKLQTSKGDIVIELFENESPIATANFISLVEKEFYDGLSFHRVLQGFMAQGGDPKGDGTGGPGYTIPDECRQPNHRIHFRGSLSMAKSEEPDTGGSQFFLTFIQTDHLNGKHTVFGRVIDGIGVLARLQKVTPGRRGPASNTDKIIKATVLRKRNHQYTVPQATAE